MNIPLEKIIIKKRIREDIGDLDQLVESIKNYGLLNPITITEDNKLIAGYRRLMAVKQLGWPAIECHIVGALSKTALLEIEIDENNVRKDLTGEEINKYREESEYLSSNVLRRFFHLIMRFFKRIAALLGRLFKKNLLIP